MSQKIMFMMARYCLTPLYDAVLLALADEANDNGLMVDVSLTNIASKSYLRTDQVITVLGHLLDMRILSPLLLQGLGHVLKCYQLNLDWPDSSWSIEDSVRFGPIISGGPIAEKSFEE